MKIFKVLLTASVLQIIFCFEGAAQDISKTRLNWHSISTFVPPTGETQNDSTQLIIYSGDSIQWMTTSNTLKYSFAVLETNGSWADVSQPGSIIYEVDNKGKRGVITIQRSDAIRVRMVLNTVAEPLVYELNIDSIKTF
jgi:hypothetical protein